MNATEVSIRLCRLDDIPVLLEIRRNTFQHFAPGSYSPEEVATLLADVKKSELVEMVEKASLFVAEQDGRVVGCGGWLAGTVRHMYVSPELTRQRIGSALLQVLESDYKQRTGGAVLRAGVILYAREFYEKNGYEFLAEAFDWDGRKFLRMQKNLESEPETSPKPRKGSS